MTADKNSKTRENSFKCSLIPLFSVTRKITQQNILERTQKNIDLLFNVLDIVLET